jgi:trigger factor
VTQEIERLRNRNSRLVTVEREAKDGDVVIIDYSGSVEGVKFEGGTAENQSLKLGSGSFIPGFEEQVVGMKAGEEKV